MNFYDETTRQLLALFIALGAIAIAAVIALRVRGLSRLKRERLRRYQRRT